MVLKDAKRKPHGSQRAPKGTQRTTKMHPKMDLRKRSRKGSRKGKKKKAKVHYFVTLLKFFSELDPSGHYSFFLFSKDRLGIEHEPHALSRDTDSALQ